MKKFFVPFVLVLLVCMLAGISLLASGGDPNRGMTASAQATATYGAEQYHIQLTAIAVQDAQP
jgi:hypothetical protein